MRKIMLVSVMVWLAGCASLIQTGSMSDAYKKLGEGDYAQTLRLLDQAETVKRTDVSTLAKIAYLKAQAYQGLGDDKKATSLYLYLMEQHSNSQWGYLASTMQK